jgi:hypothetical protein
LHSCDRAFVAGSRTTGAKRQKERQRAEKRLLKEEKKARRKEEKENRVLTTDGDPDLEGIVAGPQPIPE